MLAELFIFELSADKYLRLKYYVQDKRKNRDSDKFFGHKYVTQRDCVFILVHIFCDNTADRSLYLTKLKYIGMYTAVFEFVVYASTKRF